MKQSSVHYFNDLNKGKAALVNEFMSEYRNALQIYVKYIWSHVPKNWELPKYASYIDGINDLIISGQNSRLSAKVLQCAQNQAMQAVKAITNPMKKRAYVIRTRMSAGDDVRKLQRIQDREARKLLVDGEGIPAIGDHCNANLDSQMWDFQDYGTHGVVQLKCLENARLGSTYYGKIRIPVTYHRQYHKFKRIGVQKKTIAINNDRVHFIFDVPTPKKVKKKGRMTFRIVDEETWEYWNNSLTDRSGYDVLDQLEERAQNVLYGLEGKFLVM